MKTPKRTPPRISPAYFTVPMGTGITSIAISHVSTAGAWLVIGTAISGLNAVIFAALVLGYLWRLCVVPEQLKLDLANPHDALFFGAVPMALATLVNATAIFSHAIFHKTPAPALLIGWGIDLCLAIASGAVVPYLMFTRHANRFENLSVFWLIPVVPAEVTAASGGVLLPLLPAGDREAIWILSMIAFSLSVPLALGILTLLFLKFATHSIPLARQGASAWIAVGPLGTGALAIVELTHELSASWLNNIPMVVGAAGALGLIAGLVLWGYGLWWWAIAVAISWRLLKQSSAFDMGWWAFTFPLGVFNLASYEIGAVYSIEFFRLFALAQTALLALAWVVVTANTARWVLSRPTRVRPLKLEATDHQAPALTR